ncbi:MAG: hypothetical protein WCI51_05130 [Lentisphaerota bacterium]
MKSETAKKILHGICGAIFVFFAGLAFGYKVYRGSSNMLPALGGAVIMGILAFLYTDYFWENLGTRD